MKSRVGPEFMGVLQRFMPATTARIVMQSCLEPLHTTVEALTTADAARVAAALVTASRFFVRADQREALGAALDQVTGISANPEPRTLPLAHEHDLSAARLAARHLTQQLGAGALQTQKAATAVSELARNVLDYAKQGKVELIPIRGPPAALRIVVTDQGPGIPHLEAVLGGKYQSKTGMGLGILGVKRMADRFEIRTGQTGTRIEVEFLT